MKPLYIKALVEGAKQGQRDRNSSDLKVPKHPELAFRIGYLLALSGHLSQPAK